MATAPNTSFEDEDEVQSMNLFGSGVGRLAQDYRTHRQESLTIELPDPDLTDDHPDVGPKPRDERQESLYMSLKTCVLDVFKADVCDIMKSLDISEFTARIEEHRVPPEPPKKRKSNFQESIYRRQESKGKEEEKDEDVNLLVLRHLDVHKVAFVQDSKEYRKKLTEHLKRNRAEVQWEDVEENKVIITEVKTDKRPSSQEDVQAWREETELEVNSFFKDIMVRKIPMMRSIWTEMKTKGYMSMVPISDLDKSKVIPDDDLPGVIIVGSILEVTRIAEHIQSNIKTIKAATLDRNQKQRTSMSDMETWKLKYLLATDFRTALSNKYSDLEVIIDMDKKVIELSGSGVDVTKAKFDIEEVLVGVECKNVEGVSKVLLQAYTYDEFQDYIQRRLSEKDVKAAFEVLSDELRVYGKGQMVLEKASKIIRESTKITYIQIDSLPIDVWKKVLESIHQEVTDPFYIDNVANSNNAVLVCAASIQDLIMSKLREATEGSSLSDRKLKLERGIFLVLKRRCQADIAELKTKHNVKIFFDHPSCVIIVRGTGSEVHAMNALKDLSDKVAVKYYGLSTPGATKFLKSLTGDTMMKQAEDEFNCIIDIVLPTAPQSHVEDQQFKAAVNIVKGNLSDQLVDVIVNSVDNDLDLSAGIVGRALISAAGSIIQKQLNRRYHHGLQYGDVGVTVGGNLRCKSVFHCCIPHWGKDVAEIYQETLKLCLDLADASNYSSVAFPALGCGRRGYPPHLVAKAMLEAIKSYEETTNSGIKEVNIVISESDADIFTAFDNERHNWIIGANSTDQASDPFDDDGDADEPVTRGVAIVVKVGELAETKADVLVNSSNINLDLSQGAVSQSLLKQGGIVIQKECKQRYPRGIKYGQVVATGAGKIRCKNIYHCCLPHWVNNTQAVDTLSGIIDKCLDMACESGCAKIAFPALGTGVMKYPPEKVASIFKSRVSVFSKKNPLSCLKEIIIVLYHKDVPTCKVFNSVWGEDPGLREKVTTPEEMQNEEYRAGLVHLDVKVGSIFEEKVDAVVVATDKKISLKDTTGQRLIVECGHELMKAASSANITKSGAVIIPTKKLPCSQIMFVAMDYFKNNMEEVIQKCIRKADKNKIKSLSIPHIHAAIDTDSTVFVSAIMKAINLHKTSLKDLREINIVLATPEDLTRCCFLFRQEFGNPTLRRSFVLEERQRPARKRSGTTVHRTKSERELSSVSEGPQLRMLGTDRHKLHRCEDKITNILKENLSVEEMNDPAIKVLSQQNIDEIKETCHTLDVSVQIDQMNGVVKFSGVKVDALMAYRKTQEIIKFEFMRRRTESATRLTHEVQWYYLVSDVQKNPFPPQSNMSIEEAYSKGDPNICLEFLRTKVILDLRNLYMEVPPSHKHKILRETSR